MDKVLQKAKELNEELRKEPLIIEFFRIKKLFEEDQELEKIRKDIARLSKNKSDPKYLEFKTAYESHPLVSNYYELRDEVVELLKEIKEIIL